MGGEVCLQKIIDSFSYYLDYFDRVCSKMIEMIMSIFREISAASELKKHREGWGNFGGFELKDLLMKIIMMVFN